MVTLFGWGKGDKVDEVENFKYLDTDFTCGEGAFMAPKPPLKKPIKIIANLP
ncbi:hypothetical protein [Campylobacter sp. MIT 12-5580]|uniref:hypothetical protein n=1 Tax=Campylobacter sp. MIT 12-5580 TaxID=2040651 RepID=UPI0014858D09|nr:hypothetical protein [Campylobacter sp. MIT 12-5580]